jgi:hypothetical protein
MGFIAALIAALAGLLMGKGSKKSSDNLKSSTGKVGNMTAAYDVNTWAPLVHVLAAQQHPPYQDGYCLKWIAEESGGNPCAIGEKVNGPDGYPQETGIGQLYTEYQSVLKFNNSEIRSYCVPGFSQQVSRALTAEEMTRQVQLLMDLIKYCKSNSDHYLSVSGANWSPTLQDYWKMVKLWHALPGLVKALPMVASKLGRPPNGWAEYKSVMLKSGPNYGQMIAGATPQQIKVANRALKSFANAEACGNAFIPFPNV